MVSRSDSVRLLIAEDDEDDYLFIHEALKDISINIEDDWVKDGEELMEYLLGTGDYQHPSKPPIPDIIFLDINMPKKNGLEALKEIKSDPNLKNILVIILTASNSTNDINSAYKFGANSYLTKPSSMNELNESIKATIEYWCNTDKIFLNNAN